jgi:colanic acid/amylovoran biosynthesis protein
MAKKILIANLASPENPGDHAILLGTIKAIRSVIKDVDITILTRAISYKDYYFKEGLKAIASYPNVDRLNVDDSFSKLLRLPETLATPSELRENIKNSDYVFLAGGAYFYSYRKGTPGLTYLSHISASYWAKKFSKPVFLMPQSYGPFNSWISEKLFEYVLRHAKKIYYREGITGGYLKEKFEMYFSKTSEMPDLALFLEKKDLLERAVFALNEKEKVIGVTIRPWNIDGIDARDYADKLSDALVSIAKKRALKVKIIVQVMDQKKTEGDEKISEYLKMLLFEKYPALSVELFCEKPFFTLSKICSIYASCDMLIGMRLHSSLLSFIVGCPALTTGYQHKAEGILKTLSLEDLYIGSYQKVSIKLLEERILDILDNRASFAEKIEARLVIARQSISDAFKEIFE